MNVTFTTPYFLIIYLLLLGLILGLFLKFDGHKLNEKSLHKQPLFWLSISLPLASFLYFESAVWTDYYFLFNADGYNKFIEISKLPLALLALSIPFVSIVNNVHRTIQTEKQIQAAQEKNKIDSFYSHEKNIVEKINLSTDVNYKIPSVYSRDLKIKINNPYSLYKEIFQNSRPTIGPNYNPSVFFIGYINSRLNLISEEIKKQDESSEHKEPDFDLEIIRIIKILKYSYEILDKLKVNYAFTERFTVNGHNASFTSSIKNDSQLRELLKFTFTLSKHLFDILNVSTEYNIPYIRMFIDMKNIKFTAFENSLGDDFKTGEVKEAIGDSWIDSLEYMSGMGLEAIM